MQKLPKAGILMIAGIVLLGAMAYVSVDSVQARPQYVKQFIEAYPNVKDAAKKAKCKVCHPKKDKKVRNAYGEALKEALGAKNVKDKDKIKEAIGKTAEKKNSDGKTYGDIIKGGALPAAE